MCRLLESGALVGNRPAPSRRWLIALVAIAVIAAHVIGVWYGNKLSPSSEVSNTQRTKAYDNIT